MEVLISTTKLILVLRILYLYYEVYPGLTELILVLRSLFLSFGYRSTRRYYRTFCWYKSTVGTTKHIHYTEVPVGTTGLILILVYKILFLYFESCTQILYVYYGTYTCLTELILVLQNLYGSYRTYTGISEHILVFRILYVYYRTYTCISNLIHVIQNLYLSYGTYTGLTEHILILRILSLCEGTRRYNKSELIIIVSHTRLDQTYADTYQVWTLVHSKYRS